METSPSFKQALRIVIKRNIVRLALLLALLAVWWIMMGFRSGDRYSIAPKTLAKVSLARVQSPSRLLFNVNDPREKKIVNAEILALDSTGLPEVLSQHCSEELFKRLENQSVWLRSAYLGADEHTVGKVLLPQATGSPEDVGLSMLQTGCAFYCRRDEKYLSPQDQKLYQEAQERARNGRLGVWADASAKPSDDCLKGAP